MRQIIVFLVSLFFIQNCISQQVTLQKASQVADGFVKTWLVPNHGGSYVIKEISPVNQFNKSVLFLVNYMPEGYVVLSGSERVSPILAYSPEGFIDNSVQAPDALKMWLAKYIRQIEYAEREQLPVSEIVKNEWEMFLNPQEVKIATRAVAPLLHTTWNQNTYYNEQCPFDTLGVGGHAYAGCVPTAMGQVMNYFRWPLTGTGSYAYLDSTYGQQSVNFANANYVYNQMPSSLTRSNADIARLLYHLGVSCDLRYGVNGSGMYNHKAAYSMRTYFKYLPTTQYLFRDSTTLNWKTMVLDHLDRKIPMYYAGWEADSLIGIAGHAFVCDGYQDTNYFHFNWGWGGSYNGYFKLDYLVPASGTNFNYGQELVINAYPDTINYTYPYYCSGTQVLTASEGVIDDGSGPIDNYVDNANCMWLIQPVDSVKAIRLNFLKINLLPGDMVTVYNGATTSSPVLGTFTGSTIPSQVQTTGNRMLIKFSSNASGNAGGFLAAYSSTYPVYCSGQKTLSAPADTFSDGSLHYNYQNNSLCRWVIEPPNAATVTLWFTEFDVDIYNDYIKLFDNSNNTLLATFKGNQLPPPVTSPSGRMRLMFYSNLVTTAGGWTAVYTSSQTGLPGDVHASEFAIWPNPASQSLSVFSSNKTEKELNIRLFDFSGRCVYESRFKPLTDIWTYQIPVENLAKGSYILQINGENSLYRKKVILQ